MYLNDFNSIKVQLERNFLTHHHLHQRNFNSIKVQLEHSPKPPNNKRHRYFNSIKVQLELSFFERQFYVDSLFQFHKGTIRTRSPSGLPLTITDFNSIKVQLEHLRVSFVSAKLNFNSIKVQLELANKCRNGVLM